MRGKRIKTDFYKITVDDDTPRYAVVEVGGAVVQIKKECEGVVVDLWEKEAFEQSGEPMNSMYVFDHELEPEE